MYLKTSEIIVLKYMNLLPLRSTSYCNRISMASGCKIIKIKLDLLIDINMLLMVDKTDRQVLDKKHVTLSICKS